MGGFLFKLETLEGEPAEPSELSAARPDWRPGDTIHLGPRTLLVGVRDKEAGQPPVLVVEDTAAGAIGRDR